MQREQDTRMDCKSMATPMEANMKKLSDFASSSDLVDPAMMTNVKKLSDSTSDSDLVGS